MMWSPQVFQFTQTSTVSLSSFYPCFTQTSAIILNREFSPLNGPPFSLPCHGPTIVQPAFTFVPLPHPDFMKIQDYDVVLQLLQWVLRNDIVIFLLYGKKWLK